MFGDNPCIRGQAELSPLKSSRMVFAYSPGTLKTEKATCASERIMAVHANVYLSFFMLKLLMNSLNEKLTPGNLKRALQNLPCGDAGLEKLYDQAMSRIHSQPCDSKELAMKVLSWLVHAQLALPLEALLDSLAIEPGTVEIDRDFCPPVESIVSVCAGLTTFDEHSKTLRLVHKTTEEYFTQNWRLHFPEAHAFITDACLAYMSLDHFSAGACKDIYEYFRCLEQYPLYSYATVNWVYHANMAEKFPGFSLAFLQTPSENLSACAQFFIRRLDPWIDIGSFRSVRGVHLAALLKFPQILEDMIAAGQSPESEDGGGRRPLWYAVCNDRVEIVDLLLRKYQVDPNRSCGTDEPVLCLATERQSANVVKALLADPRIDPNVGGFRERL